MLTRPGLNVIFCAYRDWALPVLNTIKQHPNVENVCHCVNNTELDSVLQQSSDLRTMLKWDLVLLCGWSSPPDEWMTKYIPIFSEHPATDDRYSNGSPIQNQILDGMTSTKHRLVKVGYPELEPRQWSHEVPMSLKGDMNHILSQMQWSSQELFNQFLRDYPDIIWNKWEKNDDRLSRRQPGDSELTIEKLKEMKAVDVYNFIRCLGAPYPNAFIKDETGKVSLIGATFER